MMGRGVLWLIVGLVMTAPLCLTIEHLNSSAEAIQEDIEYPVNRNGPAQHENSYKFNETPPTFHHSNSYPELNNIKTDSSSDTDLVHHTVSEGSQNNVDHGSYRLLESKESHEPSNSKPPNEIPATTEVGSEESDDSDKEDDKSVQSPDSDKHPSKENMHETESSEKLESFEFISGQTPSESTDSFDNLGLSRLSESDNIGPSGEESIDGDIVVQTTHGPVKLNTWAANTEILASVDIPYGYIKDVFGAPHVVQSWIDVHDVQEHDTRCPQYQGDGYVGDLNCLTLSIFTPVDATNASVFFYVHDSRFGSGDPMIYGPEHLVSKGVILVLPNYRLGVLGFLCLHNETAPGNAGLKDLAQALEWTRANIEAFGGNPSNIIIGGDGDAGALAGYLALYSNCKDSVHKVITESGSLLSHLALDRNPLETATIIVEKIMTNQSDGTIYNNTFVEASLQTIVEASNGIRFNPCVEHDKEPFIQVTPWTRLHDKEIDITFMIGSATYAGTHEAIATSQSFIEQLNEDLGLILPNDLSFENAGKRAEHALSVKNQYFGDDSISLSKIKELSLWSTDASYLAPLIRTARPLVQAGAKVFLYEFAYVGNYNRELISLNNPVEGAVRSDIVGYLFTQNGHLPEEGSDEERMINLMVDLWVSFINTGVPSAENITWNELKATEKADEEYLLISSEPQLVKGVHVTRLELWTELYDEYFIERNFALLLSPGYYAFIVVVFWITNIKLDYDH